MFHSDFGNDAARRGSSLLPSCRGGWEEGAFSTLANNDARRSLFEIMAQILGACHANAKKTTLMYRCNMSFKQLTGYLDLMLGAKLLLIENSGPQLLFRISGKGRDFLKAYENLKRLME
jgi:predicted transcriptional regulator